MLNQQESTAIDIVFATPVTAVSIRARFTIATELYTAFSGSLPFMAVYNSNVISTANRIGLVTWDNPSDPCLTATSLCNSSYQTLSFSSPTANIRAIRLSAFAPRPGSPFRRAIFDSLTTAVQVAQSITFPQPGNVPTGWQFFHFASASSGLPVTVTTATPSVCTISGDEVLLGSVAGTCTLTANQPGDANYFAAAPVTVSFTVFNKTDVAAGQRALLGTDSSWRVTASDPGTASGWNTNAGFNDSGWQPATILNDLYAILGRPFFAKSIWTSGGQFSTTETTIWGRRVISLAQVPSQAWMELGADDDIDLYINGVLVVNDSNGVANNASRDIRPYLVPGNNLFAFVVRDNFTVFGYNHGVWLQVRSNVGGPIGPAIASVPMPAWALAALAAALATIVFLRGRVGRRSLS